jgi:hypothetical protein
MVGRSRVQGMSSDVPKSNRDPYVRIFTGLNDVVGSKLSGAQLNIRRAKYYEFKRSGKKQLETETDAWLKFTAAVTQVLEGREITPC